MKQIIYKEVIEVDGVEYTVMDRDYSETINELIADQIIPDHNRDIFNYITDDIFTYITDDIVNSQ